jgi:hypothetical protein
MQPVPGSMAMQDIDPKRPLAEDTRMTASPRHVGNSAQGSLPSRRGSVRPGSAVAKRAMQSGASPSNAIGGARAMENMHDEGPSAVEQVRSGSSSKPLTPNQSGEALSRSEFIRMNASEALGRMAPNDIRVQSDRIQGHQPVHMKDRDRHVAASANPIHRRRLRAAIMAVKLGISDKWSDDAASTYKELRSSSANQSADMKKKVHPYSVSRQRTAMMRATLQQPTSHKHEPRRWAAFRRRSLIPTDFEPGSYLSCAIATMSTRSTIPLAQ